MEIRIFKETEIIKGALSIEDAKRVYEETSLKPSESDYDNIRTILSYLITKHDGGFRRDRAKRVEEALQLIIKNNEIVF